MAKKAERRVKGKGSLQLERNGTYTIRAMINGQRFTKGTGTKDRAQAERMLEQFLRPFVKNDDAETYRNLQAFVASAEQKAEDEEDKKPQMKVTEAWQAYVDSSARRDLAESTLENKAMVWGGWVKWLKDTFPQVVELRKVSREMVELYLKGLRKDHAASTYNNRLCALREITRVLMKPARIKENPWDEMKLRDDDSHTRRELTIEELERLFVQARRTGEEWVRLFAVAMYTGMRLGDAAQLAWKEIDLVRGIIQYEPRKTRKHSKGRVTTVPIHTNLADNLMETPKSERLGEALPTIAKWYRQSRPDLSRKLKSIFNNAGIVTSVKVEGRKWKAPEATFHSLRHTFVSLSGNAGVPLHIVQSIVGHGSTAMTRIYFHESEAALRQAISAIPMIGCTQSRVASAPVGGNAALAAQGVDFFPETPDTPALPPAAPVPVAVPVVTPSAVVIPAPERGETAGPVPMEPEVLPPPPKVEIPRDAKVEIREFGRVYVNGVATGGRIGGIQAKKLPPKAAWMSECIALWSRRRKLGILEGTMELVGNGGHKFLDQLYARATIDDPHEAVELTREYLKARGIEFYC